MPNRPSSSKSSKPNTSGPGEVPADGSEGEVRPTAAKTPENKEVLSLIDNEKPAPRKRGPNPSKVSALPRIGGKPPPPVEAAKPPAEPRKTVEDAKKEALNLFEEKPKVKRRPVQTEQEKEAVASTMMPPISLLHEPTPAPVVTPAPAAVPAAAKPVESVAEIEINEDGERVIHLKPPIIVKDLALKLGVKPFNIISELIPFKIFASADKAIDVDIAEKICEKHGVKLERDKREKGAGVHKVEEVIVEPEAQAPEEVEEEKLELRAPIITFMGHVDHGKTSLLDAIRKARVAAGEAGGITQHIGAYSIEHNGRPITFIDTPGHAAFSEMRARGANVTDIVVLVVAADDGIMPQTREALSHAKAAGVTIMVALNKCDLPAADVMRVKGQLQEVGLMPVDWGGETECLEVSATKGLGLDDLLETMAVQSEVLELKADPKAPARATVIESSMVAGKGPVASVIVRQGTLRVGKPFICGPHWGKVKALLNDRGEPIKLVKPGMPAEVIGFSAMPNVGDEVVVMDNERDVKRLSEERQEELRQKKLSVPRRSTLETMFANIEEGNKKTLKLVIKGDVQGSVEAIKKCLNDIPNDKVYLEILHAEAGPVNESDVLLCSASDAVIIGFNVKLENKALSVAKREGVQVKLFSIIYELIDQVKDAMKGLLDPITRENVIGHAKVKQVFKVTRGKAAGCQVTDGRIDRKQRARVLRSGQAVYDGGIETLKRFQDEVPEVRNGLECGIKLGNFSDYEEGDIIECYQLEKIPQNL
jgi:translation initiation factor IF-2